MIVAVVEIIGFVVLFFMLNKGLKSIEFKESEVAKERENNKLLIDSMPVASFLWDESEGVSYCNDVTYKFFGLKNREDFFENYENGKPKFQPDGSLTREIELLMIDRASKTGHAKREMFYKNITEDVLIPCEMTMVKVKDSKKVIIAIYLRDLRQSYAMVEAIEQRKRLESEKDIAEKVIETKMQFLANMSHEIRTPMNAIRGMSQLLVNSSLDSVQMGYVKDIQSSSDTMLSIINEILDFSKLESGKIELVERNYDFVEFLDQIQSMSRHIITGKSLDFNFEIQSKMPKYIYGDEIRLKQILWNVIGNAAKYTEQGYVSIKLKIQGDYICFEVSDSGIGIRESDLDSIFDPFVQFDKHKNQSVIGTGLGLSIAKSYVDLMGGSIDIQSEYGRGSTFVVSIPTVLGNVDLNKAEINKSSVDCSYNNMVSFDSYFCKANILVVDDNEINLNVAKGLFGLLGISIATASSGLKAIEMVKQRDFDMVFMDHMMPVLDGIQTTKKIRELGSKFANLTIIALTANAINGAKQMFLDQGLDDFISKPIDNSELKKIIIKWSPADDFIVDNGDSADYDLKAEKKLPTTKSELLKSDKVKELLKSDGIKGLKSVKGIDAVLGLANAGNNKRIYISSLKLLDARLEGYTQNAKGFLEDENLKEYATLVHGLRGVLSTLGMQKLSEIAYDLELRGKSGNFDYVKKNNDKFFVELSSLNDDIQKALELDETNKGYEAKQINKVNEVNQSKKIYSIENVDNINKIDEIYLNSKLKLIKGYIEDFNKDEALNSLDILVEFELDKELLDKLKRLELALLSYDFDTSLEIINE